MALKDILGWNKMEDVAASAGGTACGASDEPSETPSACGASDEPVQAPTACGSACGASDK